MLNEGDQKQILNAKDPGPREGASQVINTCCGPRLGETGERQKGGIANLTGLPAHVRSRPRLGAIWCFSVPPSRTGMQIPE